MVEQDNLVKENQKLKEENEKLKKENKKLEYLLKVLSPNIVDDDEELDKEILFFLQRSERRFIVLKSLNKHAKSPIMLNKELKGTSYPSNSYVKQLKDKGLIVCLNEFDTVHRYYTITPKGKKYLEYMEEINYTFD